MQGYYLLKKTKRVIFLLNLIQNKKVIKLMHILTNYFYKVLIFIWEIK